MSLFDTLKKVIFHNPMARPGSESTPPAHSARPATPATNTRASAPGAAAPSPRATPTATAAQPSAAPPQPAAVDVEAILEALNAKSSQKLNWRTSIVDLMKLVGLDSSLQKRQELAAELGYSGDKNDSAAMNIWLHKAVMRKLAENGGKVPASLQ
jgi:3-oxoacyl-ACP reductase-like protein